MKPITWAGVAVATLSASACGGSDNADINTAPTFVRGAIASAYYDGNSDDLLTAGLGLTGLKAAVAPAYANAAAPTVAELRRNAIYTNYRAVVDYTDAGGVWPPVWPQHRQRRQPNAGRGQSGWARIHCGARRRQRPPERDADGAGAGQL